MVTIVIKGAEAFNGFDNFRRGYMGVMDSKIMLPLTREITKRITDYPPKLPGQKYERTFTFRRSWRTYTMFGHKWAIEGFASQFRNPDYTSFVIGDEGGDGQVGIHYLRWPKGFKSGKELVERTSIEYALKADAQFVSYIRTLGL